MALWLAKAGGEILHSSLCQGQFCLADLVKAATLTPGGYMCTFDVVSLFTKVPLGEVIDICADALFRGRRQLIHLFAGRAAKRERRKGSSRRQQPAYGAAVNEVARELLRSVRSPKRENGGRRYIKHDGMIASPVGSCLCC